MKPPSPQGARSSSKTKELLRSVVDSLEEALLALDDGERVVLANPAAEELLGVSEAAARGRPLSALGPDGERLERVAGRARRESRTVRDEEVPWKSRTRALRAWAAPRFDPRGSVEGTVLVVRVLTDPLGLAESSRRLDRHAFYATLAAGLAHEVRNPLGGIRGAVQLLEAELPRESPLREHAQVALREVQRLAALTESLLDLGRTAPGVRQSVNLHRLLDEVLATTQRDALAQDLVVERHYDPSLPSIAGEPEGLGRLFHNLVRNAVEATGGRGRVTVTTGVETGIRLRGSGESRRPSAAILRITISDDGPGIPAELQARLFVPFATTKRGGTGLGLALARKVAVDHGGWIVCASEPGKGAAFTVYLPLEELR